jgi:hypothetical protein
MQCILAYFPLSTVLDLVSAPHLYLAPTALQAANNIKIYHSISSIAALRHAIYCCSNSCGVAVNMTS